MIRLILETILNTDKFRKLKRQLDLYREISRTRLRPIDLTYQHVYEKVTIPDTYCKYEEKGLVFIWPKRKNIRRIQQITNFWWYVSHILFWLYVTNFLPSGSAVPIEQPPWIYEKVIKPPKPRDFIIEPDW